MIGRIYLLLRRLVFFCWRRITASEMEEIAAYYHYKVIISPASSFPMHPWLKGVRIIGLCSYLETTLSISSDELRVFWHEMGHGVSPRLFRGGGKQAICWAISEIVATIIGFYLNIAWRKRSTKRKEV